AELDPDIVCLSKSLSGYGLPLAVTLLKPHLDQLEPGKHNGTFRGHNLAFVTAKAALDEFWRDDRLSRQVAANSQQMRNVLAPLEQQYDGVVRGRGMIQGIELADKKAAGRVARAAFRKGLLVETSGPRDEVLKLLPPLTIDSAALQEGLGIIEKSFAEVFPLATVGASTACGDHGESGDKKHDRPKA